VPLHGEHVMTGSSRPRPPVGAVADATRSLPSTARSGGAASSRQLSSGTARRARTPDDIHLVRALVTSVSHWDDRHPRRVRCAGSACPVKDIGELGTSTDRQDRHLESTSLAKERELPFVAVRFDRPEILIGVMTVAIRFHVRSPLRINPSSRARMPSTSASRVSSTGSPPARRPMPDSREM